ncbi:hypothetical protein HYFRA_00006165 [Hymenoscyphus fraxineus]|uniref:alpha-galactosidase n=1 Tax=Hymenoscyphus fraxineus TaxID=746836 RepID=A0A9N9Q000_9HELO|nr:hypothetical protein HYFRA_00006165 [Hymenoscyphus fraxineus]
MRSALNIALALAAFTQATSAAALPEKRHNLGLNRWKHHSHRPSGSGRFQVPANATRTAGPGTTVVSIPDATVFSTFTVTATATPIGDAPALPTPTEGTTEGGVNLPVDGNDGSGNTATPIGEDPAPPTPTEGTPEGGVDLPVEGNDGSGNSGVINAPPQSGGSEENNGNSENLPGDENKNSDENSGDSGVIISPPTPSNSEENTIFPTLTLPASYKPTGFLNATGISGSPYGTVSYGTASLTNTAAGPTTFPSSTSYDSSPPILPSSSEDGEDTVIIQTVVPIPASTSAPAAAPLASTSTRAVSDGSQWKPAVGATWQIQLHGTVTDTNLPVDIYDIDLIESTPALISTLHANNKKVICYFSAGSFESWRPDATSFASSDKGSPLEGWDNEWWLNTNSANVRSIMKARLDLAKSKGCDGVDPDNVDVYSNSNGLGITKQDSLAFLQFLSSETRARGMAIGMKNGLDMVTQLLDDMDFHVNESCLEFSECEKLVPFITAGKPVFHIEYPASAPSIAKEVVDSKCKEKADKNFSSLLKNVELDAWVQTC